MASRNLDSKCALVEPPYRAISMQLRNVLDDLERQMTSIGNARNDHQLFVLQQIGSIPKELKYIVERLESV